MSLLLTRKVRVLVTFIRQMHDTLDASASTNGKYFGIGSDQRNDGDAGIPAASPAVKARRRTLFERETRQETVTFGMLGTLTCIATNRIGTFGSHLRVTLWNQGGTGLLILGRIQQTFVDIFNNDPPRQTHIGWRRPWRGHGIVDVKFTNIRQTAVGHGNRVGNFERPQILFGIFILNIDKVFLVDVALLETQGLVTVGIVFEFHKGRTLVDTAVGFVHDVAGLAATAGTVARAHDTNLVFPCVPNQVEGCVSHV